jgi:hypothetical protein
MNRLSEFLRRRWAWVLAALALLALLTQFGGVTLVVRNQAAQPVCAIYVSTSADPAERGPNRLWSRLRPPQSRDIRLPLFLTLFTPAGERELHAWAVDCDGAAIEGATFRGGESLFLWEVDGQDG